MNPYAVTGFVTSLASLLVPFFGLTGIVSLALSSLGLLHAKLEKSRRGLSVAGIIVSIVSIVLAVAENVLLFLYFTKKITF